MRSKNQYIISKQDVYSIADCWMQKALQFEYQGTKCNDSIAWQVLFHAAALMTSIAATCRELIDAPCAQSIYDIINHNLPGMMELQKRLNNALITEIPKFLLKKKCLLAIDLTLIPYHGEAYGNEDEIYRSLAKNGTTHFHAYATAVILHKGLRYTVGLIYVEKGSSTKEIVQQLLKIVRAHGIKIDFLLLDKEFFSVAVILYLKKSKTHFIIPAFARGRKPKHSSQATGLRAIIKQKNGFYQHTLKTNKGHFRNVHVTICVASKWYHHKKDNKRRMKRLMYCVHGIGWKDVVKVRETYRKRFGIETSYRQMNQARIFTTTQNPASRFLYIGIALVLRNIWVWLHYQLAKDKRKNELETHHELLPFRDMLAWLSHVIIHILGNDQHQGLTFEKYKKTLRSG